MATVTIEELAEAKRLYTERREVGDPEWEDAHSIVIAYYVWLARRRLA